MTAAIGRVVQIFLRGLQFFHFQNYEQIRIYKQNPGVSKISFGSRNFLNFSNKGVNNDFFPTKMLQTLSTPCIYFSTKFDTFEILVVYLNLPEKLSS